MLYSSDNSFIFAKLYTYVCSNNIKIKTKLAHYLYFMRYIFRCTSKQRKMLTIAKYITYIYTRDLSHI